MTRYPVLHYANRGVAASILRRTLQAGKSGEGEADAAMPKELTAEQWREADAKATAVVAALLEEEDRVTQAAGSKDSKKKKRGEGAPVAAGKVAETAVEVMKVAEVTEAAEVTETAETLQGIAVSGEISDALDTASVQGTEQGADSASASAGLLCPTKRF
jgi:hypothetical protein